MSGPGPSKGRSCRRIIFHGRVQGVGFRYTAAAAAKALHVSGYVRNCPDGTVELVADGPVEDVEGLLERLNEEFAGNIKRQTSEDLEHCEARHGFEIRR
jgi:acylphosphatase